VTSTWLANTILILSLIVSLWAYVFVSRKEGSYFNVLTPTFLTAIPAYYLLPLFFSLIFGTDATAYAYAYVYATLAVQNVVFALVYTHPTKSLIRLPFLYSFNNLAGLAFFFVAVAVLLYVPVILQFPEYLLDPREIYRHTRTGFGLNYYTSSTFAYLAVVLILFSKRSRLTKGFVILAAAGVLILHGSKGQVLALVLLVALYFVYVNRYRLQFLPSLVAVTGLGFFVLALLAATMALGDSPTDALESISTYSDYTRNAMLVIDSHFPVQYGKLTLESQVIGRIPRALMPSKPKNYGALYLDDEFFPQSLDEDAGSPDFGIGVQYADFGILAIVYLSLFEAFRAWMARTFKERLALTRHPADFFLLAFAANIQLIPVGGIGWLLPEALVIALFLRVASGIGATTLCREQIRPKRTLPKTTQSGIWGIGEERT